MHGLWRRVIEVLRPRRLDRETVDELSHHVELLVDRKMAAGLDERQARRQALAEVGSVSSAREQIAEERTGFSLDQLARELTYAARVLRRSAGVTFLSILTMGVGIGASTVLAMLVNAIVLRPLPYPEPERLVRIFDTNPQIGVDRAEAASGNIDDWRIRTDAFDGISAYYVMGRTVGIGSDADVMFTAQVTQDFFEMLGVTPVVGRSFTADETRRALFNLALAPTGADPVVMLSHGVWMRRFGGNPDVVGQVITVERRPFRIVGVMPARFALPDAAVQLWIPWGISRDDPRDQHYAGVIARLKKGLSIGLAEDMLNNVARELGAEYPTTNRGWSARISPLAVEIVGGTAAVLWILLASVGFVLLIACANVGLLSLMRALDRSEEMAVRLALGASTARLFRERMLESALLAFVGGVGGAAVAVFGVRLLPTLTPNLPRLHEVGVDGRVLAFVAIVTGGSAILSGLPQAWRLARVGPLEGFSAGSVRTTGNKHHHALRDGIVVIQNALAVVLLMAAGLFVRSLVQLRGVSPGFDPRGVLVAPIFLDNQAYNSADKSRTYYRTLFERLSTLPGVTAVGGATTVPTSPLGPDFERPVWPEGSAPDDARRTPAAVRMVTPGYFKVMNLRVVDGRAIDDRDSPKSPRVVMISETLARRIWPGESAVGRMLVVDYSTSGTDPYEIVGVVGDLRFRGPRSQPLPEIYLPHAQRSYLVLNVVIKTVEDPRALMPSVRATLKSVDPQKPAQGLYPLEDLLDATYVRDRQAMVTLLIFALAAIFLAVLSVCGVLSQRVRERSQEIGIRMALGANAPNVIGWVAGFGLRLVAIGLVTGTIAARPLSGTLDGLLFGVAATDGLTTLIVVAALAGIGAIATLGPSLRATRIDPIQVLKRG